MAYGQFLELVGSVPGLKILIATTHADGLTQALAAHAARCEGELCVAAYPGEHLPMEPSRTLRVSTLPHFKAPFHAAARDYEIIILHDLLHRHEFREKLLRHAYQGLENSALLIVVQELGTLDAADVESWIEACEYRVVNTIEGVIPGAFVTVAKKLHMWGNGM